MKTLNLIWLSLLISVAIADLNAQVMSFNGQVITWSTINPADPFQAQGGLRYIPKISFSHPAGQGKYSVEGELSANLWGSLLYSSGDSLSSDYRFSPYRAWIKFSGEQFEVRAGLQKINFGSAIMLRPLMWFDRMDPRDPLQLTDGVYGLLGRYYFANNANIWLWGLYGNKETKGWEAYETARKKIELGGRAQLPLANGEIALSYHHRMTDPSLTLPDSLYSGGPLPEDRLALDGKFTLVAGLWFETTLSRVADLNNSDICTSMLNLGTDYTFNLGEGLHMTGEYFTYMSGDKPYNSDQYSLHFGGVSLSYPINIIHSLSLIVFHDFTNRTNYRFLNWSIMYDKWSFYIMGFWNPETYTLYNFNNTTNLFGGWGFQLMAVFNH